MKLVIKTLLIAGFAAVPVACSEADSSQSDIAVAEMNGAPDEAAIEEDHSAHMMAEPEVVVVEPEPPAPEPVVAASAPAPDEPLTIYSGVYNTAQAERGKLITETECVACHAAEDWAGGRILTNYTGQSMLAFVETLRSTMPMDGPGRLEYAQYVDVATHILQINGVPSGSAELSAVPEKLAEIRMEYRR